VSINLDPDQESGGGHSNYEYRLVGSSGLLFHAQQLDFGDIPLGTPIDSLPRGAKWRDGCDAKAIGDCSFNLNGVSHGTHWDDNIVVMKTIEVGKAKSAWLPYGLRGDETIELALARLNLRFSGAFQVATSAAGRPIVIARSSDERLNSFEVSLRFERNGRLSEVRASCCYN
jgi:hypothetical protein